MATITIYEKIENKGLQDAKKILEVGHKKALELEFTILDEAKKQIASSEEKNALAKANLLKTKETEFEQTAKQVSLARKKALIDEVFTRAHERLNKISDKEWEVLVLQLLSKDELKGNEEILASASDKKRFVTLFCSKGNEEPIVLDRLNDLLKKKSFHLTLSEKVSPVNGGFFVLGTDFDIDHSYVTLLQELKEQEEANIASILFDGRE